MKTYYVLTILSIGLLSLALVGCSPASSSPTPTAIYTTVSQPTLKKGDPIPVPKGDVILKVTGNTETRNIEDDKSIQMDLATLESMGLVDYTVNDPFEKKDITYRGVLMSTLLDVLQVSSTAKTLHIVALNDYAVDVPIQDLRNYPVIFALKADGEYMPISTHGPAMLVYPYNDFTFDQAVYNNYWIWQIASIDVR
jgi:hypothetical protein